MELNHKMLKLRENLKELGNVVIAFSGGVDSTFLLKIAHDVLGEKALAVTATSSTYPEREFREAINYTKKHEIRHIIIESEERDIEGFSKNPINRCYYCKHELFSKLKEVANENSIQYVLDGSNYDDIGDFRPGMKAAKELKVISPLKDAKLTKDEIRKISKRMNIPTWNKPAFACLSSRFPYGQEITDDKLRMVETAEDFLLNMGFKQIRVRHHGKIARIEVDPQERERFFKVDVMDTIGIELKKLGFTYVTLDILGYRTGSMNEVLK